MAPMATSSELHVPALALVPLPVFHFLWALQAQLEDFPPFCPLPHPQLTTDIVTFFPARVHLGTFPPTRPHGT